MMAISLNETPSIYFRGDKVVVIFPSTPYWFSATKEIAVILKSFKLKEVSLITASIARTLQISIEEARDIYTDVSKLLYQSGVLSIDGYTNKTEEFSPESQVSEVENVLVIATTQQCNMSCPMCYAMASKKSHDEMTTGQIKGIIDQLARMPWKKGISRVALTGGELFTRPDAIELIKHVYGYGFFAQVNTNATLLTDEQIKELSRISRLKISVSLDGCKAITHESIRGAGTFDITVETIRKLCESGISVAINMFVHAGNIDEIKETLILADSLGVDGFNCLNMMDVGRGNSIKTKKILLAVPLATFYRKVFEGIYDDENLQRLMIHSTFANQIMGIAGGVKSHSCGIGTNRAMYVKPDGSLYPCADTALPYFRLGNLRSDNLSDIWANSALLKELRSLDIDTMNAKCAACDVRYLCAGNCRGEHFQTAKDVKSPHFKCEEIHASILEMMWILTDFPKIFSHKVTQLYDTVRSDTSMA